MTVTDQLATASLQERAHRHLLMHFTRNGAFGPGGKPLLVLERGEGAYVFDTDGKRYFDGLSSLFCAQIGYSFGEEMAAAAAGQLTHARVQHQLGDGAPAVDRPRRGDRRARPRRPQPHLLHQRRLGVGRGGVEDRPPVLPRQGRAAAHQGDLARDRLPRRHARRALVHGRAPDEGAVRRRADPRRARLQHQPVPRRRRRRPGGDDQAPAGGDGAHDRRDGAGDRRDGDRRARAERGRLPRPARRLLGRAARAVRPLRDRARRRRGDHGLRAHRRVVRRAALRRHAGPDHDGQGHHLRLRADGRRGGQRPDRRAAVRGRPHAPARHHLRRPPGRRGDGAREHRDLRARGRARERARERGATSSRSCARCRSACRSWATCAAPATSGRSSSCATRPARASPPRSASGCCAATSPAGCSRRA